MRLEAPKRQIDVSSLSAALAAQAIARETDRISTMEADIRERAFFNRRLKGERFMDRRQQEIQDWEVEQARLKGQAERLRRLRKRRKRPRPRRRRRQSAADRSRGRESRAGEGRGGQCRRGEGRRGRRNRQRRRSRRSRAEERPGRRQWPRPCGPDAPAQAQGAPDASRPGARQALLIWDGRRRFPAGQDGRRASRLEHEHPDGR